MHIGKKIQEVTNERGMQITELGRRIGKTSQAIYDIFKRDSISTDLLQSLGTALNYDFFQEYVKPNPSNLMAMEPGTEYGKKDRASISLTINNIAEKDIKRIFKAINDII